MMHRIEEVVERGMCVGCGVCAAVTNGAIPIRLSDRRLYQADLEGVGESQLRAASRVCPFSDESRGEDELASVSLEPNLEPNALLGPHNGTFAGRVNDPERLLESSSGGLTSWLLDELLKLSYVNGVIHVGPTGGGAELFEYDLDRPGSASNRRKSRYYATSMADVLEVVMADTAGRFALVGVPCYIKAVRSLCQERPEIASRFAFFVGLVCGHMKTQAFAESLAWQQGIAPQEVAGVDFRVKNLKEPASSYNFAAWGADGVPVVTPVRRLVGGNWGHNAFQPEACNFCDDVVGETADVSFGDAWLPEYEADARGTNVVVSRNALILKLLEQASERGLITLDPVSASDVVRSQAGGFRHRREGLAVRLADDVSEGLSVPVKRVLPDASVVGVRRANLYRQRRVMASRSHEYFSAALASGRLDDYIRPMLREITRYDRLEAPLARRSVRRVRRMIRGVRSKFLQRRGRV